MTPPSATTTNRSTARTGVESKSLKVPAALTVPPSLVGAPTELMKTAVEALAPAVTPPAPSIEDAIDVPLVKRKLTPTAPESTASAPVVSRSKQRKRTGGVAPEVRPMNLWDRFRQGRVLERRGFVALSPGRSKRRHRILPRTAIGISFMLLSMALGLAFAGAGFYAYYDNRLAANEQEIARFVEGFDDQFVDASDSLNQLRGDSLDQIRSELQPLGEFVSEQNGVVNLPAQIGPSVYQLRTTNERGAPAAGTAAAVAKHQGGTALVTSYSLVKSSTITPAPGIELVKGDERIPATLWSWDVERDLALIVVDVELPRLVFATEADMTSAVGSKVFAMSGTGGQGATASPGTVLDRSEVGLQHTAAIGDLFNGGPLVSSEGKLVGIASVTYAPLGFTGGDVRFASDLSGLCSSLLNCADPIDPSAAEEPAD